jgi:hypothetical protein
VRAKQSRTDERGTTPCSIVGAVAQRNVVPILLEGLSRLEYHDYDSAGVAVINGTLQRLRCAGRVEKLVQLTAECGFDTGLRNQLPRGHGRSYWLECLAGLPWQSLLPSSNRLPQSTTAID